jgi:hypothetical protein
MVGAVGIGPATAPVRRDGPPQWLSGSADRFPQIFHANVSAVVAVIGGEADMGRVGKLREDPDLAFPSGRPLSRSEARLRSIRSQTMRWHGCELPR